MSLGFILEANAKTPGATYCFNAICHRIRTISETHARRGVVEPVIASFYDDPDTDPLNPRNETSSGEYYRSEMPDNAASPIHPDGTILLVWSPLSGGAAIVRVNNTGPYYPGRTLDVSRGVASRLGFTHLGIAQLLTVVIYAPTDAEARHVRARTYAPVRGYLGRFESLALASLEDASARQVLHNEDGAIPSLALMRRNPPKPSDPAARTALLALKKQFADTPNEEIDPTRYTESGMSLAAQFANVPGELVTPDVAAVNSPPARRLAPEVNIGMPRAGRPLDALSKHAGLRVSIFD